MCNPNMEAKVHELMELKRMKEELEAEIAAAEDAIKAVMGDEELLTAGAYKVSWKTFTSSRVDTTALKKALPEVAAAYTKTTMLAFSPFLTLPPASWHCLKVRYSPGRPSMSWFKRL